MSDTNTPDQAGVTAMANSEATEAQAKMYATKAEAEANKPADASKALRPFEVLHNGTSKGWVMARGHDHAVSIAARLEGFSASLGTKTAPVTKEAVVAKLAEFSDDELAAMGLSRKPQRGAGSEPTTTTPEALTMNEHPWIVTVDYSGGNKPTLYHAYPTREEANNAVLQLLWDVPGCHAEVGHEDEAPPLLVPRKPCA